MYREHRAPTARILAVAGLLSLLGTSSACAPPANLRPASPLLSGRDVEFGLGYAAVSPRPVGQDPWEHAAQGWFTWQALDWLDVGVTGAFDDMAATIGLTLRARFVKIDFFAAAVGVEIGYGWAGVELPFAFNIQDRVWLYSSPHFGNWGRDAAVRLPVGLGVRLWDGLLMRGETQVLWPDFDPYARRISLALALAYQL